MSHAVCVVSRRDEVIRLFHDAGQEIRSTGGLLELFRCGEIPRIIAVDAADIDLLMSDAALKVQRQFPAALLVALRDGPASTGPLPEGVDEVLEPESAWLPGVRRLQRELEDLQEFGWSGKSETLRSLLSQVKQAGPAEISVLITGESGSGKELVASALHRTSPRAGGPFVAVNTGAIPETLLESELFGHERGAFTGAAAMRRGIFESARGGTVFLDEIGDMPPATQVKLLRVLEARTFRRLGSTQEIETDVRLISATHRDLAQLESAGAFRRDLFYRLSAVTLRVAALRDRPSDVLPLLSAFWSRLPGTLKPPSEVTVGAVRRLRAYAWPGNVRELRNFAEASAVAVSGAPLTEEHVLQYIQRQGGTDRHLPVPMGMRTEGSERELLFGAIWHLGKQIQELRSLVEERLPAGQGGDAAALRPPAASIADAERRAIEAALLETGGNRREASRRLHIGERTLYRKIKEYGLK
jgi:DNA-binding NtrC family response regulator